MSKDSSGSANSISGQKSKRSFSNPTSSNPSNSNGSNKKKKTNQKTLGVAWGSNSLSSSRSSFRKAPFSDFGSYMVEKYRKLHNQFDAEASSPSRSGSRIVDPIFHGVSIFVDGFTVPSNQELRSYMVKYGGRFENYFTRQRVTHIICSNLPDSKIKNLRAFSGGLPVVKPLWILDSVAANKLLSWVPYQLDQLANNQPKLPVFFTLKCTKESKDDLVHSVCQAEPETEDSSLKGDTSKDTYLREIGKSIESSSQTSSESYNHVQENTNATNSEELAGVRGESWEVKLTEASNIDTEDESSVANELEFRLRQSSASVSSHCLDDQNLKGSPNFAVIGTSNQSHSTLEDPNFVDNYFKSSRLHFIGTWRNRYRKRFPSLCNGFTGASSNVNASGKTAVIHVDMDCFFVSVVIRNHPELGDKPVAVCHSDNAKGTAEISSANYPARDYGVRAGMFVRNAKALCPQLVIFPYNFEAYEEVADQFYCILHKHCNKVQAVSCDEAFLDVTDLEGQDPELLASSIRKEISETTGCTASAGIAQNMLMARLATRTAKPDGQSHIPPERVDDYLSLLPIGALPGIGHVLEGRLKNRDVHTCGQLRMISKDSLQKDFGLKTGEMLWSYSRGVDNRLVGVIQESKSIGAEVNWGVRFRNLKDSEHFLLNLCKEVSLRLQGCGVQGRTFTLKIKKRRKDAKEPAKYMGCGDCENFSHSLTVPLATDNVEVLQRITKQLFGYFHIDVKEIRGIGLQVSRLENADTSKPGAERNSLKSWLTSASATASMEERSSKYYVDKARSDADHDHQSMDGTSGTLCTDSAGPLDRMDNTMSNGQACINQIVAPPPLSHLDVGVIENLPPELFTELNEVYGGKLVNFIAKGKGTSDATSSLRNSCEKVEAMSKEEKPSAVVLQNKLPVQTGAMQHASVEVEAVAGSAAGFFSRDAYSSSPEKAHLMPSSLSQVDTSVLQQLPEDLRTDILEQLPAHRRYNFSSSAALGRLPENCQATTDIKTNENHSESTDQVFVNNLWTGHPPHWVDKFKGSNCLILNNLTEMYYRLGMPGTLSPILQRTISESRHLLDAALDSWDETISIICELFKQYIKLKIEIDIEEIYICFRLLKRIAAKSQIFLQVYDVLIPYLQASVGDKYGGNLLISLE
ncbi:DNA repair protein REV1 [Quillaja saponaria]|uniref:DNA repair protein REV1 n=1 Tax=Quillaja saponaria TaxID=32244 RepID=A0AAD7KUJ8_QUISA|nr:DNA repair protein REV1 [Quillaja saponaria]KAJ7946117.1 DNA repair protein REV1 [Quillaja saponaria]